jgi:hypothetical protein
MYSDVGMCQDGRSFDMTSAQEHWRAFECSVMPVPCGRVSHRAIARYGFAGRGRMWVRLTGFAKTRTDRTGPSERQATFATISTRFPSGSRNNAFRLLLPLLWGG